MNRYTPIFLVLLLPFFTRAQQTQPITFQHDGLTVNGVLTLPNGTGKFPVIIINAGTGANDKDGTIPMLGGNVACLYPGLLNDTLYPYKELANGLVDSGYAVLRYDKLEYTYPGGINPISFHKLWLPVESAINYVKTRTDIDTNQIVLMGHSEGSSLIPFITKTRNDVKALISIGGPRSPLDSLLAYQIIYITQTCNGDTDMAKLQATQILDYFNIIRTNTWNSSTPPFGGIPASVLYDYIRAVDSVAVNYNICNLPTLFLGLGLDLNVPPAELVRLQQEVTITNDFWSLPGLVHYMAPNNDPHVPQVVTDTIIHWLKQKGIVSSVNNVSKLNQYIEVTPNPLRDYFSLSVKDLQVKQLEIKMIDSRGIVLFNESHRNIRNSFEKKYSSEMLTPGIYFLQLNVDGERVVKKIVRE